MVSVLATRAGNSALRFPTSGRIDIFPTTSSSAPFAATSGESGLESRLQELARFQVSSLSSVIANPVSINIFVGTPATFPAASTAELIVEFPARGWYCCYPVPVVEFLARLCW